MACPDNGAAHGNSIPGDHDRLDAKMEREMESHECPRDNWSYRGIEIKRFNDIVDILGGRAKNGGGLAETAMPRRDLGYWRQQEEQEAPGSGSDADRTERSPASLGLGNGESCLLAQLIAVE